MTTYQISKAELDIANYERFNYPDIKVQKRFHVLWLKANHFKNKQIALIIDVHRNTVKSYLDIYQADGIEGLKKVNYYKPKSELDNYKLSIEEYFRENPPLTVKEARKKIHDLTGIEKSISRTRSFMKRIGMKPLKTGHIPAKADPERQRKFVADILQPLVNQSEKGECHLLFMDGVHFVMSAFVSIVWCFERVFIKSSSGRFRINLLGAVNAKTKELTSVYNDTYINALTVVEFLKQIRKRYRTKVIYIVLDNARYQYCQLVKETAESLNIKLVYLPPYSPNLNIIERLWKFIKQEVCAGNYFENKLDFENAILDFVESLYQKEMRKILKPKLTCRFQLFDNAQNVAA